MKAKKTSKMKWILCIVWLLPGLNCIAQHKEKGPERKLAKYEERMKYYLSTREPEEGKNLLALKRNAYNTFKKRQKQNSITREHNGYWEMDGPLLINNHEGAGRVNRLAFHPTDPDVIYAASAGGGLWVTKTHGTFWYPITSGIPYANLSGVAVDPNDPNVIYILTGDGVGASTSASGTYSFTKSSIGVLKTEDEGAVWKPTGLTFDVSTNVRPYELKMSPANPQTLYASTDSGLFRTTNGGATWDTLSPNLIYEIEFKPGNASTLYAVDNDNFYKSTNGGISWPDTVPIAPIEGEVGRMTISTTPANPNVIHLLASPQVEASEMHRGVYYSNNSGGSFNLMNSDTLIQKESQGNYDLAIATSYDDASELVTGCVIIYGSTDNGSILLSRDGTHADIHELIVNPLNEFLYAATDGGVFYSEDFGLNWTYLSTVKNVMQYYKISVGQTNENLVIGGSQDNGTHRNMNVTSVFDRIYHKDGMDCAIHPGNDSLMIYSAQNGEFWMSTDMGTNEDSLIHVNNIDNADAAWVTPIAWDPQNADNIYIGSKPIYRSSDMGASFNLISDTVSGRRVLHAAINNRLYAGDSYEVPGPNESHLWTSTNNGDSWTELHTNSGFPSLSLVHTGITTDPADDSVVWLSLGGWVDGEKVYRSNNGGNSWQNMSGSLPNVPVNCIIYQGVNTTASNAVYVGTDIGVFYRDDALGDWIYFSNGLPPVEVADLEIRENVGRLVAGTYGRGIWETDLYSECPENLELTPVLADSKGSFYFQVSDSIQVANMEFESFGSSLILKAGNVILLEEGFSVKSDNGAFFKARTGPCSGGVETFKESDDGSSEKD